MNPPLQLLSLALLLSHVFADDVEDSNMERIIGGKRTRITEAPYQSGLCVSGLQSCGGTILNRDHVLTAAHCVSGVRKNNLQVRAGTGDRTKGGSTHRIVFINIHPNFDSINMDFDMAILTITPPFVIDSTRRAITLTTKQPITGTNATLTGWGWTRPVAPGKADIKAYSTTLQSITIPVYNRKDCRRNYAKLGIKITRQMECVGVRQNGQSACRGDSGGPVVIDGELVGVVSYGVGCAVPNYPTVAASVYIMREWILKNM